MKEPEFEELLSRDISKSLINEFFSDQLGCVRDIVNYGSNLIPRAFNSSNEDIEDVMLIGVLLKHIVAMLDSSENLITNSCIQPAWLQARSGFEASLYIDWILESETQDKAKAYFISGIRNNLKWENRNIKGTIEREEIDKITQELGIDVNVNRPNLENESRSRIQTVNNILDNENFRETNKKLVELKESDRLKREPAWYRLFDKYSIRSIAKDINRLAEYEVFYTKASDIMHASQYGNHVSSSSGSLNFKSIRTTEGLDSLLYFQLTSVLYAYQKIIEKYRPGEVSQYSEKYKNDWKEDFNEIYNSYLLFNN